MSTMGSEFDDTTREYVRLQRQIKELEQMKGVLKEILMEAMREVPEGKVVVDGTIKVSLSKSSNSRIVPTKLMDLGVHIKIIEQATIKTTFDVLKVSAGKEDE